MAERPHPTRRSTLHRLVGLEDLGEVHRLLAPGLFDRGTHGDPRGEALEIGGVPARWFWGQTEEVRPLWLDDVRTTLGRRDVDVHSDRCGVLIALAVDGEHYSVTYGDAWRWIGEEHRDPSFGLQVLVRCLDPGDVRTVMSRRFGQGRTDTTHVAQGTPVWAVRPQDVLDVVRRLAGRTRDLELTRSLARTTARQRREVLEGASGLRLPLGVRGHDLVADIRRVRAVLDRRVPEDLAFVDTVRPATRPESAALQAGLERLLGTADAADHLAVALPDAVLAHLGGIDGYAVTPGPGARLPDLTAADVVTPVARLREGRRVAALRRHRVSAWGDDGDTPLVELPALRWLETVQHVDDEAYYLVEGEWVRVDSGYARQVREDTRRAFDRGRGLALPSWRRRPSTGAPEDEGDYNERAGRDGGLLCLDKRLVRGGLHGGSGIEVCDLLAPDGTFVHVKRAKGSAVLSHLFAQGANAVEALQNQRDTRERFRRTVAQAARAAGDRDPSRFLPDDLVPRRLVFAVMREAGPVTAATLYPMSAATLAQTMRRLERSHVSVEVVPIALEPLASDSAA